MKNKETSNKILSVGFPGFPKGFAQVQRQILLAKCLTVEGFEVTVLCRYGVHEKISSIPTEGIFDSIRFCYCSGVSTRPDGYFKRNFLKLKGLFYEALTIYKSSRKGNLAGMLISTNFFHNVLFYWVLAKLLNIRTIIDNVEYWTSFPGLTGIVRIEKILYDRYYFRFTNKIISISDFLTERIPVSKRNNVIKIPAITDFEEFENIKRERSSSPFLKEKYFLYCGAEVYHEVIEFIISAFELADLSDCFLILVTKPTNVLQERIRKSKKSSYIRNFFNLPYSDLVSLYAGSAALIIPLRNTIQDKARFPHKISEYCASGRPIITNSTREICNYFNTTNAYLCSNYNIDEYSKAMIDVISDGERARIIALKGYETGLRFFNYRSYSKKLADFINS